jgi:hypothetical protein
MALALLWDFWNLIQRYAYVALRDIHFMPSYEKNLHRGWSREGSSGKKWKLNVEMLVRSQKFLRSSYEGRLDVSWRGLIKALECLSILYQLPPLYAMSHKIQHSCNFPSYSSLPLACYPVSRNTNRTRNIHVQMFHAVIATTRMCIAGILITPT